MTAAVSPKPNLDLHLVQLRELADAAKEYALAPNSSTRGKLLFLVSDWARGSKNDKLKLRLELSTGGRLRIAQCSLRYSKPGLQGTRDFEPIFRLRSGDEFVGRAADAAERLIEWRRGRDSNPRYPFEYAGLANLCLQPLGHLSCRPTILLQRAVHTQCLDDRQPANRVYLCYFI